MWILAPKVVDYGRHGRENSLTSRMSRTVVRGDGPLQLFMYMCFLYVGLMCRFGIRNPKTHQDTSIIKLVDDVPEWVQLQWHLMYLEMITCLVCSGNATMAMS